MGVRSYWTDAASFQQVASQAPSIDSNHARVWIFSVEGGPNAWDAGGTIGLITFNRNVFRCGGHSFFYVDLPSGHYLVTTGNVLRQTFTGTYIALGEHQKEVDLKGGHEYFVNGPFREQTVTFEFIDKAEAQSTMQGLTHWTMPLVENVEWGK